MTLAILHLSDIHIHEPSDSILKRTDEIAKALNPFLPEASTVVILLSGDIAQTGAESEYFLAKQFVDDIVKKIGVEKCVPIRVIVAPGNHDCDFTGDQEVRQTILAEVLKRVSEIPNSFIIHAVKIQNNFVKFRNEYIEPNEVSFEDLLWQSSVVEAEDKRIIFDVLNAPWMSSKHEQQGGLLFPYERYHQFKQTDADLRVVTLHHPLNWYNQRNYLRFKNFIHQLADILVTGHEHQSNSRDIDEVLSGECVYVEGAALQSRDDFDDSGFNIIEINLSDRKFRFSPFRLEGMIYKPTNMPSKWAEYRALPKRDTAELELTESYRTILNDPGATLKHPSGLPLSLGDIYVFPDLDVRMDKRSEKIKGKSVTKLNSKILLQLTSLEKDVLLEGGEVSGKTRLLYRLYAHYHSQGHLPLLIRGKDIKQTATEEIQKCISRAIEDQYGAANKLIFEQASISKKVLLLDDLDSCPIKGNAKRSVLGTLKIGFHRTLATVSENYELAELFSGSDSLDLVDFEQYLLSDLGYERRGELIRKWTSIGRDETLTANEILKTFDDSEKLIESARLQHIASTVPIYVLSLLQASASGLSKELHNSSFAHYYYFLIVGALERGGVKAIEMGPYIVACTHLSWFVRTNGEDQRISESDFKKFVVAYSAEWTATDSDKLLQVLVDSKLVEVDGGAVFFAYPYAYYYFLGRYASISLSKPEVVDYLRYCLKHLYVRECANTLLFLAHHTANSEVLDHITKSMQDHFSDRLPVTLEKEDIRSVAALMAHAPSLKHKVQKPEEYRANIAKRKDSEDPGDGLVDRPSQKQDLFHDIVSLTKSIEIAGALLTHQFPNYTRAKKVEALSHIFNGAMRAIRELYSYFENDTEQLVATIAVRIKTQSSMTSEKAEQETRLAIGMLLRAITAGFIVKAGAHVGSKDLFGNIDEVIETNPTCAYRLIKISQQLQQTGRLPKLEINRLVREEGENPCVMGPLQLLVLQRLYMYETDHDDRDWAVEVFKLGGATGAIELQQRRRTGRLTN